MSTVEVHTQITAEEIAHTFEDEVPKGVDLGQYAVEDWLTLVIFWVMALSVFLQFFTRYVLNNSLCLDRGDRDQLPDRGGLPRLGDVRAAVAAHPGRFPLPLSAASARRARCRPSIDLIRIAFFAYAIWLVWQFIQIIGDERMTTIKLPKGFVYYAVLPASC